MANYAKQLLSKGACKADFDAENPNVLEAHQGFLAYEAVYQATCQKSPDLSSYCFTDAVTNASSPTSSYIYFLPLGLDLPAGTAPTCNECLATTMNDYATFAGNGTLPLSSVYANAVQTIDQTCGPNFVTAQVPPVVGLATRAHLSTTLLLISVAASLFL